MLNEWQAALAPYLSLIGDNPWLQACALIVISLIVAWIIDRVIVATLSRIFAKTRFTFDDRLLAILHGPVYVSVILIGLGLATNLLNLGDPYDFVAYSTLKSIALIIWAIFLMRLAHLLLHSIAGNDRRIRFLNSQSLPLFDNVANIFIVVIAVYAVFSAWGIDMTAWLASAGIIGIAVGFAAKDTLANLFSGVFILADAPYKIGDYVVLDSGERGEITHIGIRSTRMRTRDDVEVTVPNAIMGNTKIINESGGPYEKYRIRVKVGVAYGSDIDQVQNLLMEIAAANENVCGEPAHRVRFRAFGGSSLDFELLCWVNQPSARGMVTHELLGEIYKRFNAEGVEIPYSKHDLYIKELPDRK
ncbi:MAG: mechanosensitive ion channel family protein [Gammaproteobacteria bacterium]|nr:mechanosensitive ion channel family protein [Gammaproteobacteria bacterium]MDH3535551.1 mechanosensitive ion channel family protein [Gammaproteobacteria bacterium]